jgi:hypothetical protein
MAQLKSVQLKMVQLTGADAAEVGVEMYGQNP